MTRRWIGDDLLALRLLSDPQLDARGSRVAYVETLLDREDDRQVDRLLIIDVGSGVQLRPPPPGEGRLPRWSPRGDRVAFVAPVGGHDQLWVWEIPNRRCAPLTSGTRHVVDVDWSPGGDRIAICQRWRETIKESGLLGAPPFKLDGHRGYTIALSAIAVVDLAGNTTWELTGGTGQYWHPRFSPRGGILGFLSSGDRRGEGLWLADEAGPERLQQVSAATVASFTWSPGGDELAFLSPGDDGGVVGHLRLWRAPASPEGGGATELAADWDRSLGSTVRSDDFRATGPPPLAWSPSNGRVYSTVADGGRGCLGWAASDGSAYGYLVTGERSCIDPSLAPGAERLAFVSIDATDPGNVHLVDLDSGAERCLTDANPWLSGLELATSRPLQARSDDGTAVEGWLTELDESGGAPKPLLVSVHGGPHYSVGWRFSADAQRLAAQGYAVLSCNPRGSGGYGVRFAGAISGNWGDKDWSDLRSLVDAACTRPGIDATRTAVCGASYGGYLTLWAISHDDRWCAAVAENGISNLVALWGSDEDGGDWLSAEMGGPPWEKAQAYLARSPIANAEAIHTPLLLIHSELDANCPIAQSEQIFAALHHLGRPVEMLRLRGEGHLVNLVGRPSSRLLRAKVLDDWLERRLQH